MSDQKGIGSRMHALAEALYPICRSITGEGVRQTLDILKSYCPIEIHEVPSGTQVFDWTVPDEWNIRDAWVKNDQGEKVIDFQTHNLHVLNYSVPVHKKISLAELKPHLFTLPDQPDLIPYRTSYYHRRWGFCLSHRQMEQLGEGTYEVYIDASLNLGSLTYGECLLTGVSNKEFILSTHICHPSLANDNLSGIALLTHLIEYLQQQDLYYSYRFLFVPGTIGAITWLAKNEDRLSQIFGGLVVSLVGDGGAFHYKQSRHSKGTIDKIVPFVLSDLQVQHKILPFTPYGYDERQYGSPGINLAVGSLTRSTYGSYPQYHTSGDDLQLIKPNFLAESLLVYQRVIDLLEKNKRYMNLYPKGEPQLGRRGLYGAIGGESDQKDLQMALLWVLNLSDGRHDMIDISQRSHIPIRFILKATDLLVSSGLIQDVDLTT